MPRRNQENRSRTRSAALVAVLAGMVAVSTQAFGAGTGGGAVQAQGPADVASEPAPQPAPRIATGDFANPPPHPFALEARAGEPKAPSFDPARSIPLDAETTPTERTYRNPDGSRTTQVSLCPSRFKDAAGAWRNIDLTLVPGPDGILKAKASPGSARLAASGAATLDTAAGPIVLRHPESRPTAATSDKAEATCAKALAGGRDLGLALVPDWVEQTVTLPDAAAPSTYLSEF